MGNNYLNCHIAYNGNPGFPLSQLRYDMVVALRKKYGSNLKVYGSGWGRELADGNLNGNPAQEAALYRGAKVSINLSHYDVPGYSSDRLYRMMACGAFVLSYAHTGLDTQIAVGRELEIWQDIPSLIKWIDTMLPDERHRAIIGQSGCAKAWNEYRWRHRLAQLTEV
jgi:spore maturation protein CgeB